jgi:putative ABC transport system permease protein
MFQNFFLPFYRNIRRNRTSFVINLIGLSTGLACVLLIYLWVYDELNVDKFHKKDSQLYQVMQNFKLPNGIMTVDATPGLLAKALTEEMPEIEHAVAVVPVYWKNKEGILSVGKNNIKASGQFVGKDFFNIFSYQLIQGDKSHVLSEKNSILISDELAIKLFNTTNDIIGKTIEWNQKMFSGEYIVSGVFKHPPFNSTAQFDLLLNYELFLEKYPNLKNWNNNDPNTYIVLKKGTNISQLNVKIANYLKSKDKNSNSTLFIRQYSDKYLYDKYENGVQAGGRIAYVRLFSIIALLIIIIACVNFMNLSTARASKRSKEVGIKKAIGADRKALIFQHLGESMLMTFLSLFIAIMIVMLLLPQFSAITGKHLSFIVDTKVALSVLGIALFTGFVSGSYPALYLSGFNPVTVLKGKLSTSVSELLTRKGLVIFQFAISIILIVAVIVVYKQITFVQSKNLGYNKDNIIYFPMEGKVSDNNEDYKEGGKFGKNIEDFLYNVKNIPGVVNVSNFWHNIAGQNGSTTDVYWEGKRPGNDINFACLSVGYDFIETLGIEMKEGRTFSRNFGSEKSTIIFNEAAIKSMGLNEPIGKVVKLGDKEVQIIGVAKNFHFQSLYKNIQPLFFAFSIEPQSSNIMIRIQAGTEIGTIARLKKLYSKINPGIPFEFKFLDEDCQALYASEKRVAILSRYFAGIAIIISCLGLFGLAAFTAERRRKEIGVRKVFGSGEFSIIYLLSGDFTRQVLVSIIIALPISYVITRHWLDSFAYKINLEWRFFLCAGLMALFIAWFTVGMQAIKAAHTNPSQCLKEE